MGPSRIWSRYCSERRTETKGTFSMEIFGLSVDLVLAVVFIVGWFVLMRYVLPRLGVST